ncbi:MAG: preprotein translocase subunit SecE [Desulfobulbaceae bacterium]|nr:preprotein translocase subunit SecE [Desulfobulbaceae bacterium]
MLSVDEAQFFCELPRDLIDMASKKSTKTTSKNKTGKNPVPEEGSKFDLNKINQFTSEVKNEFGKIAWPDKKHTVATTGVVVVLVFMISFYLGAVDLILGKLIGLVIK